mgnify:CR=1 FL=1|jgi:hypothetical protein
MINVIFGEFFNNLSTEMDLYVKHIITELDYSEYKGPLDNIPKLTSTQLSSMFDQILSANQNLPQLISLISSDLYIKENYDTLQDIVEVAWSDAYLCSVRLDKVF